MNWFVDVFRENGLDLQFGDMFVVVFRCLVFNEFCTIIMALSNIKYPVFLLKNEGMQVSSTKWRKASEVNM